MIEDRERGGLDELASAVAHAAVVAVEANVARQQGFGTFLAGCGVCLALIGAGAFLVAKNTAVEAPTVHTNEFRFPSTGKPPLPSKDAANPPAAMTKAELAFAARPEYVAAEFKGRLVADPDGLIRLSDGNVFTPAKFDPATGRMVRDYDAVFDVARFVGDLTFCNSIPGSEMLSCYVIDHDAIIDLDTTQSARAKP
jgi:hypothetical protein